jgi:hypothetical protein
VDDPAAGPTRRSGGTRHRVRRYAILTGLLAGLAVAPAVGQAQRAQPFDVAERAAPGRVPAPVAAAEHAAARAAEQAPPGGAGDDGDGAVTSRLPSRLPELTHRSAAIEEVAHRPVRLRIDALGADAPIEAFGRDGDGLLDVPADGATVAWYREGSVPGAAGSSVLAAHVDHDGRRGVFFDLDALEAEDVIRVDFDDGRTLTFEVVRRAHYAKERLPVRRLFTCNGAPVLTLITCGGHFDATTRHYAANTVVQATLRRRHT